jgi:hypothetical protein
MLRKYRYTAAFLKCLIYKSIIININIIIFLLLLFLLLLLMTCIPILHSVAEIS